MNLAPKPNPMSFFDWLIGAARHRGKVMAGLIRNHCRTRGAKR
jgi:hypothetical protein